MNIIIVVPVFNELTALPRLIDCLRRQVDTDGQVLQQGKFSVLFADNNSTDGSIEYLRHLEKSALPFEIHIVEETQQGVAFARRRGADEAVRLGGIDCLIVSTDADVVFDELFLITVANSANRDHDLYTFRYKYAAALLGEYPRLWAIIEPIMRLRRRLGVVLGAFPDGKGFAIWADVYQRVGGIDTFFQLDGGVFCPHPSDDWDFGIKVAAHGYKIGYLDRVVISVDPRRVLWGISDMVAGRAYGRGGTIVMQSLRDDGHLTEREKPRDITENEGQKLWGFSVIDTLSKYFILPLFLDQSLYNSAELHSMVGAELLMTLRRRSDEIKMETGRSNYILIHYYKTPLYRLYLEFCEPLFSKFFELEGQFGVPPLPPQLESIRREKSWSDYQKYVFYYAEDRESGEAHDYFGNGGVF